MITIAKEIRVMRKEKVSEFKMMNFKVLGDSGSKKIGGSIKAENAMLVNAEELASYLPNILGISPTSPDWGKRVDDYVRSIAVPIEPVGNAMQIGFNFDMTDIAFKPAIALLVKDANLEDKEAIIVDHIVNKISRDYWWKYGRPIEPADYFIWRYMKNYRKVANNAEDADKSTNITFYIVDTADVDKAKKEAFKLKNDALKAYFKISENLDSVRTVLFSLKQGDVVLTAKGSANEEEDLLIALDGLKESDPIRFTKACDSVDKLGDAAFVEECIARGVLSRLDNTDIIVDAETGDPVGASVVEAIVYLKKEDNSKYYNTLQSRVKSKSI